MAHRRRPNASPSGARPSTVESTTGRRPDRPAGGADPARDHQPGGNRRRRRRPADRPRPAPADAVVARPAIPTTERPIDLGERTGPGFTELGVPDALVRVLAAQGAHHPFPIQQATLTDALAGRDLLGRGRTGSGKTIAFALPLVIRLAGTRSKPKQPRGLLLVPTRELANQVQATIAPLAAAVGLRTATVFGGVGANPQIEALRRGVDVVVACPGRLEDLVQGGHARLDAVEITVLDEADHMCDLGFAPGVIRLLGRTPTDGQRMMFSATLDKQVDAIVKRFLTEPVVHSVDPVDAPPVEMDHHVFHVAGEQRLPILVELASRSDRTVMFTRTKYRAKTLARQLNANGVPAVEMHGNLAQNARERNLAAFASGEATVLVATDIAARGIHVDDVALVVHADPPIEHKAYLHRSGRTARAGKAGTVITVMLDEQTNDVRQLTRKAGINPTTTKIHRNHPLIAELTS
ncbi:MAG: DEAD/DEAH box helicase [Ilumatobacteraceae bacterium]